MSQNRDSENLIKISTVHNDYMKLIYLLFANDIILPSFLNDHYIRDNHSSNIAFNEHGIRGFRTL